MFPSIVSSLFFPFSGAVLGMTIALISRPKTPNAFKLILSFSGAFLLSITIFHLLPKVFIADSFKAEVWIMAGLLLQIILEYASQGIEHGHLHKMASSGRFPFILWGSLCVHAFIEGLPLINESPLLWGIFIHKIPVGMVLMFLISETPGTRFGKLLALFFFAVMTPLGSLAAALSDVLQAYYLPATAIIIGMLLHISTTILFESTQGHRFNLQKLSSILLAIGLAYIL